MLRITQTFLVNALATYLRKKGWNTLYEDYVNARRGGPGPQGAINYCFETIFDKFPDIVAVKEHRMLIIEVNLKYKHRYVEKLRAFNSGKNKLLRCIEDKLDLDIQVLELGLSFLHKPPAKADLDGFHVWLYNRKLGEVSVYR